MYSVLDPSALHPKVKLIIEELNTDEIITKLKNGHLDAAIAATPLMEDKIKENDTVTFDVAEGKKGLNAVNVKRA